MCTLAHSPGELRNYRSARKLGVPPLTPPVVPTATEYDIKDFATRWALNEECVLTIKKSSAHVGDALLRTFVVDSGKQEAINKAFNDMVASYSRPPLFFVTAEHFLAALKGMLSQPSTPVGIAASAEGNIAVTQDELVFMFQLASLEPSEAGLLAFALVGPGTAVVETEEELTRIRNVLPEPWKMLASRIRVVSNPSDTSLNDDGWNPLADRALAAKSDAQRSIE